MFRFFSNCWTIRETLFIYTYRRDVLIFDTRYFDLPSSCKERLTINHRRFCLVYLFPSLQRISVHHSLMALNNGNLYVLDSSSFTFVTLVSFQEDAFGQIEMSFVLHIIKEPSIVSCVTTAPLFIWLQSDHCLSRILFSLEGRTNWSINDTAQRWTRLSLCCIARRVTAIIILIHIFKSMKINPIRYSISENHQIQVVDPSVTPKYV